MNADIRYTIYDTRYAIRDTRYSRPGIVLLVTLVLLVVLSTLGYTLSTYLSAHRHRNQFIIDYQAARYGCDSAVKYALATLQDIQLQLVSRPNEPDFSDLFMLSEAEYQKLLAQLALPSSSTGIDENETLNDINDINDFNDLNDINDVNDVTDANDLTPLKIRGPYGPPWPFVTESAEFQIGSATVKIEIEDENAKYPLGWAMLEDKEVQREAEASFESFCEWMKLSDEANVSQGEKSSPRGLIKKELQEIGQIKQFKLDFKPITRLENAVIRSRTVTNPQVRRGRRVIPTRSTRSRTVRKTIPITTQIAEQTVYFAKVFHSSLFEGAAEILARPTVISETRKESVLKYIGVWGSRKVNVNTAPRHVLETAFTFGGDAGEIADAIIQRRRIKPFTDIEELRQALFSYSDSIRKCEKYITTSSSFFAIRVTATSGVARASSIIAITKDGKTLKRVAVISD